MFRHRPTHKLKEIQVICTLPVFHYTGRTNGPTKKGTEFNSVPFYTIDNLESYSLAALGQPAQPPPLSAEGQAAGLPP